MKFSGLLAIRYFCVTKVPLPRESYKLKWVGTMDSAESIVNYAKKTSALITTKSIL